MRPSRIDPKLAKAENWEQAISALSEEDLEMLQLEIGSDTAKLKPEHFISHLFSKQNVRNSPNSSMTPCAKKHRHHQQRDLRS